MITSGMAIIEIPAVPIFHSSLLFSREGKGSVWSKDQGRLRQESGELPVNPKPPFVKTMKEENDLIRIVGSSFDPIEDGQGLQLITFFLKFL